MATKKKAVKSKPDVLDLAQPVGDIQTYLSVLFYGRSGTGKTTLSCSFPTPLLIIDIAEKGTDSVCDVEGVDVIKLENFEQIEEIYFRLEDGDTKYKTVVIDAMHSLQDEAVNKAKEDQGKSELDATSLRDFGLAAGLMKTWILNYVNLVDLGIHVVFLAHDRIKELESDDEADVLIPEVGPRLMPSVSSTLMGSVNVVANTYIKSTLLKSSNPRDKKERKIDYCLRIGPHEYYNTKIRKPKSHILPDYIVDPTFDKLMEIIKPRKSKSATTKKRIKHTK